MNTMTLQSPPYCIQIELTEGCSIQCKFCGIQGIREKPGGYKYMTYRLAETLAKQLHDAQTVHKWNPRIEFAMHGEPSVNPDRLAIVRVLREYLPKTYMLMLTNGSGLAGGDSKRKVEELLEAGINTLAIEQYGHTTFHETILEKINGTSYPVMFYPSDKNANPHSRKPASVKQIIFVADIFTETKGTHSRINTHCGVGSPPVQSHHGQACAKPFREISVRWDGHIALCCNDWRGTYNCGTILQQSINTIWQGPRFDAARRELYLGNRDRIPCCSGCNETSYRPGLIPDHKGLMTMEEPTVGTRRLIKKIGAETPLTTPVLRPWEKENTR